MAVVERRGMIDIIKGSGETEVFYPRGNFSPKVVAKVEGENDGHLGQITRMPDNVTRYLTICILLIIYSSIIAIPQQHTCRGLLVYFAFLHA